jgi:hypothetical protein
MNKIIEIDTENMVAVVQSGISLYKLDRELRKHGFVCGHMPGSQPTATVGGAISTNGWSEHRMRYGDIQDQVRAHKAVWEEAYDAWGTWVTAYGPGYPLDEEGSIPYNRAANVAKHFEEILI